MLSMYSTLLVFSVQAVTFLFLSRKLLISGCQRKLDSEPTGGGRAYKLLYKQQQW